MATVTIEISRAAVYSIAEGISITISQHNGGTPTYEQLWASASESRKLDIYYRSAIGDLERRLMDWVTSVSGQFSLTADGTDYELEITMSPYWPARLEGLLKNKIQDFLVHAVTAGWLNDFDGLTVKNDYRLMGAADLSDIRQIIHQRSFGFDESQRTSDGTGKDESEAPSSSQRTSDGTGKDESEAPSSSQRMEDEAKDMFVLPREAGARRADEVRKQSEDDRPPLAGENMQRHKDNAIVDTRSDWTDMSGTGIAYRERCCRPVTRPMLGRGFTPAPSRGPMPCCHREPVHKLPPDPHVYPEIPTHAIPPKYPDGKKPPIPNGIGWSDDGRYDMEEEERFIHSHDCGHHDCGVPDDRIDWDFNK